MRRTSTFLLLLCALAGTPAGHVAVAAPEAAAPWPASARGRPLPRPSWVLAIPARRKPDGGLVIWERDDRWTKAWRVPKTVDGLRIVSLLGDSEDRRSVTSEAVDGMLLRSLDIVMRKYGAPAMALAVTDGSSVALAGYVPGWQASWEEVDTDDDLGRTRERCLTTLVGMFGGRKATSTRDGGAPVQVVDPVGDAATTAEIVAVRETEDGLSWKIVVRRAGSRPADVASVRSTLEAVRGVRVGKVAQGADGIVAEFVGPDGYDELVEALTAQGYDVS